MPPFFSKQVQLNEKSDIRLEKPFLRNFMYSKHSQSKKKTKQKKSPLRIRRARFLKQHIFAPRGGSVDPSPSRFSLKGTPNRPWKHFFFRPFAHLSVNVADKRVKFSKTTKKGSDFSKKCHFLHEFLHRRHLFFKIQFKVHDEVNYYFIVCFNV